MAAGLRRAVWDQRRQPTQCLGAGNSAGIAIRNAPTAMMGGANPALGRTIDGRFLGRWRSAIIIGGNSSARSGLCRGRDAASCQTMAAFCGSIRLTAHSDSSRWRHRPSDRRD